MCFLFINCTKKYIMRVTKEQYLQAVSTIEQYKKELLEDLGCVETILINCPTYGEDTKIRDCQISVRLLNCLYANADFLNIKSTFLSDIKLSDFKNVPYSRLKLAKGIGRKGLIELTNLLKSVGIKLKP